MRARLESPRASYATPGVRIGTTRAPRRRQLPTKRCHAALLFGATRAVTDEYLTLQQLTAYSKMNVCRLRRYLRLPPGHSGSAVPGAEVCRRPAAFRIGAGRLRRGSWEPEVARAA